MDKQTLLRRHRTQKRLLLAGVTLAGIAMCYFTSIWLVLLVLFLCWIAHETWFSDHLFYRVDQDYVYRFGDHADVPLRLEGETLRSPIGAFPEGDAMLLEITIARDWRGWFLDPHLFVGDRRFDAEHRAQGRRYLLLSLGKAEREAGRFAIRTKYCRIADTARLLVFSNPDFSHKRMMILAPHADDAELAAFSLYQGRQDVIIVTLTQGETETEEFEALGLSKQAAGRLKGRLRSWDSVAVPMWAGIPAENCVQLGYFGMRLQTMRDSAYTPFGSLTGENMDTRAARRWNRRNLPSDSNGQPTWSNLIADLSDLINVCRPEVVITPHPKLDPHPDHVATTQALREAVSKAHWSPQCYLLYANHLRNNDRWPMGPAGGGITLPPAFDDFETESCFNRTMPTETQLDKAMALGMHHDLRPRLPIKKRLRRLLQSTLAGRRWPATGESEFFRKAVRADELFFFCSNLERLT